jgi:transcriptional regulator with XRE-family HTH domain
MSDDVSSNETLARLKRDLADELHRLRRAARLTLEEMALRAHYSRTTLGMAEQGHRLPTWPVVEAYVAACGGDLEYFRQRWQEVAERTGYQGRVRKPMRRLVKLTRHEERYCSPPNPLDATTPEAFRELLRRVRQSAGTPTYRDLVRRAADRDLQLKRSTLGDMLAPRSKPGRRGVPNAAYVRAFLLLCGVTGEDVELWIKVRDTLAAAGAVAPGGQACPHDCDATAPDRAPAPIPVATHGKGATLGAWLRNTFRVTSRRRRHAGGGDKR